MNIYDRRAKARRNGDEYLRSARERRSETVMREPGSAFGRARECVWESQGVRRGEPETTSGIETEYVLDTSGRASEYVWESQGVRPRESQGVRLGEPENTSGRARKCVWESQGVRLGEPESTSGRARDYAWESQGIRLGDPGSTSGRARDYGWESQRIREALRNGEVEVS